MGAAGFLGGLAGGMATGRAMKNLSAKTKTPSTSTPKDTFVGGGPSTTQPMTTGRENEEAGLPDYTPEEVRQAMRNGKKKGGRINKTGIYQLHKGEFVVKAEDVKKARKMGRKSARKSGRR